MNSARMKIFAILAFLSVAGCTSNVVHTYSMPVKNDSTDEYGRLPERTPRYTRELSARTQPNLYDNNVSYRFQMSNSLNVQDGRLIPDSAPDKPLLITVRVGLGKSRLGYRYELNGALTLASGAVLHPIKTYVENISLCSPSSTAPSISSVDLKNKYIEVDPEISSTYEVRGSSDHVSFSYGCVVFGYAKPVSVYSVFSVNFGVVEMSDGHIIPMEVQFYPMVLEFKQK